MQKSLAVVLVGFALSCSAKTNEPPTQASQSSLGSGACSSQAIHLADLHADFRDIWRGFEVSATGKQATPNASVALDFGVPVQPDSVNATFTPVIADGSCGATIPAALASAVIAADIWGSGTTDALRKPQPAALNLLARDSIDGVVSSAGSIAAGGDITLKGMSINWTSRQPVGMMAGGKFTAASGSVSGDVTFGKPSSLPQTVSVSGQKVQKPFVVGEAFQNLVEVANLIASESAAGLVQLTNSNLHLTGTSPGVNAFRLPASMLQQTSSIQISVPQGAGAIVDVTGASVEISNKGISLQGATASTVLWNFAHADSVNISSISIPGSLLAPHAKITFNSGTLNGILVVRSFTSTGSGTLQYSALNAGLLFGSPVPSSVTLMPLHPLVRSCTYTFSLPNTTVLNTGGGCLDVPLAVTFRVAKDRLSPADRELTDRQIDHTTNTLQGFIARSGINTPVKDALARYESAIGVSVDDLVPGTAEPTFLSRTQLQTQYKQTSQGYPVRSYGYVVLTESGTFRSALGKVMPNLPNFPTPAVTSANALQTLLSSLHITQPPWIAKPAVYQAPAGTLTIVPTREYPASTDFKLAWSFRFGSKTGILDPAEAEVDAATGAVLGKLSAIQHVATLDPSTATFKQVLDGRDQNSQKEQVTSIFNGLQPLITAQYQKGDSSLVSTLATGPVTDPGVLVTGIDLTGSVLADPDKITLVADPTPDHTWTAATELVETRMASAQWALETANDFMIGLGLDRDGVPWQHVDGPAAKRRVVVSYFDNVPDSDAAYSQSSDDSAASIYIKSSATFLPVSPNTLAHEYGHALVHSMRNLAFLDNIRESGSIGEGIADLFALARNQAQAAYSPWYCYFHGAVDPSQSSLCTENIADPHSSTYAFPHKDPGQPDFYKGTLYQDFVAAVSCETDQRTGNDGCGAHLNSTIVSHWGYLLAVGAGPSVPNGTATVPCGLFIPALNDDLTTSLRIVVNIALRAASTIPVDSTFTDFRTATVQTAISLQDAYAKLSPGKPSLAETVNLAWDAVGLPADSSQSKSPQITPADDVAGADSPGVDPWVTFTWPTDGLGQKGTSWDFQLADSPSFDATHMKYASDPAKPITETKEEGAAAFLSLALPFDGVIIYYWRVRPHSNESWASCYPIHTFTSSGNTPRVNDLKILSNVIGSNAAPVVVRPGSISVQWKSVNGSEAFDVEAAEKVDPACSHVDNAFVATTLPDLNCSASDCLIQQSLPVVGPPWLLPNKQYFLDVQPVGPLDFDGNRSFGECTSIPFDTGAMRPPDFAIFGAPRDGEVVFDGLNGVSAPPEFKWSLYDGAVQSRIRFFDIDGLGTCATTPTKKPPPQLVETPTLLSDGSLGLVVGDFLHPDNPYGYCWDVAAVAGDGQESSPSSQRRIRYQHEFVIENSPGVEQARAISVSIAGHPELDTHGDPSPLPGDSYGSDVIFKWEPDPSASGYMVSLSRWEPPRSAPIPLSSVSPPNCIDANSSTVLGQFPDRLSGDCEAPTIPIPIPILTKPITTNSLHVLGSKQYTNGHCSGPSCGRYCWKVWPIVGDAGSPQPFVNVLNYCYTSGPSFPEISISRPLELVAGTGKDDPDVSVNQERFSVAPISGGIHVGYVPDNQLRINVNDSDIVFSDPICPASEVSNSYTYRDLYDCDIDFTIHPRPSHTYKITAQVFNSANAGPPIMDEDSKVNESSLSVTTPGCGEEGEGCCPEEPVCDIAAHLGCDNNNCTPCGRHGETCCEALGLGSGCFSSGDVCVGGTCNTCGHLGEACCFGQSCTDGHCDPSKEAPGQQTLGLGMCVASAPPPPSCQPGTCDTSKLQAPQFSCGLTNYLQQSCTLTSTLSITPDLDVGVCSISQELVDQIVDEGLVQCEPSLAFLWTDPGAASGYDVFVRELPNFTLVPVTTAPKTTAYSDSTVIAAHGTRRLFNVIVRGNDCCGDHGPAAVGLFAVSDSCPPPKYSCQ